MCTEIAQNMQDLSELYSPMERRQPWSDEQSPPFVSGKVCMMPGGKKWNSGNLNSVQGDPMFRMHLTESLIFYLPVFVSVSISQCTIYPHLIDQRSRLCKRQECAARGSSTALLLHLLTLQDWHLTDASVPVEEWEWAMEVFILNRCHSMLARRKSPYNSKCVTVDLFLVIKFLL